MSEPLRWLLPLLLVALVATPVLGAVRFTLTKPEEARPVRREILGINLNYLVDGELLDPAEGRSLVAGLRALGVRNLRFPGGNKSDSHLWSVPPYRTPAPRLAVTGDWDWPAMSEDLWDREAGRFALRVLDTDDALAIAGELDAELVMVVPYDEAYPGPDEEPGRHAAGPSIDELVELAAAWAEYCKAQGRPPRYWEIGNETYFHEGITARRYAADLVRFAEALHAVDPGIRVGANGPGGPDSVEAGDRRAETGERWWPTVLAAASGHIDYLSLHSYPCYGWRSFDAYAERLPGVVGPLRNMRRAVDEHAPAADRTRIELLVTETNSADWLGHPDGGENWPHTGSIGHALVLFDMLAQYLAHDDLEAVQVWNTRWVHHRELDELWDALGEDNAPSTIGQMMALWQRAGSHWLRVEGAGRAAPVRCFATHDAQTGAATVFLVNRTREDQMVALAGPLFADDTVTTTQAWVGSGPDDLHPTLRDPADGDPGRLTVPAAGMLIVETTD